MDRVTYDLNQHQLECEHAERVFNDAYEENLQEIITRSNELLLDSSELIKYCESLNFDMLNFISDLYLSRKVCFSDLPASFIKELFEGICREMDINYESFEESIFKSETTHKHLFICEHDAIDRELHGA